ncbi:MAG: hypothetical protein GTN86_07955 [Xanthomonadales bacterium]|nr:hypothetical protein [Xanthomonadales bacterium]NIN59803.1 hypothetical protein [Xanthomonadales bacterium]NIN75178.1 hypothetical protein [Xanthomonadales bacterium]NIO15109.1 hypothetical protein [Xanthomonadales bacterium]NIP12196.1 hypothetical protein [Xanthomonadales bacterium]
MAVRGPERGAKPQHFSDPALDGLYQMMLVLAEELAAIRERLDTALAILASGKTPTDEALDAFDLGPGYDEVRRQFVQRLLEPLEELIEQERGS